MARRTVRAGLTAGVLALALIASACGDSGDSKSSSSGTQGGGSETNNSLQNTDCGTLKYDKSAPTGGTFTDYAWLSDSGSNTSFDPGVVQTLSEAQITTAMFDGLTDFDFTQKCGPVLKGAVASKWTPNSDASEFTFDIKKGEKFSDGSPVLPSSFKIGWERAGSKELASPYGYLIDYIKGGADLQAGKVKTLPSIVADDSAMTLKVTLESPNADFPAIVSHQFFSPITKKQLDEVGNTTGWGKGITIGNGPFKLEKATEQEVDLVPNPNWSGNVYGDTKVHLDKIIFKATVDVGTAYQAFQSGEGDSAPIPPGQSKAAQAAYKNNTVDDPNLGSYYFDLGDVPSLAGDKNLELRRAISLAINRGEINDKVYEGTRQIAGGITPPGIPGYKKDLCKYCKYNVTQAKEHLKKYTDAGGKIPTDLTIQYNQGGGHDQVAQVVQANLKDNLGITAKLDPGTEDYFREIAKPGACVICRSGWYADYPTYGNFMVDLFSKASIGGNNFARFNNPDFEAKIKAAQAETDETKRGELYNQAEDILLNQQTATIPIVFYTGNNVFRDNVVNSDQPPLGIMLWERLAVSK